MMVLFILVIWGGLVSSIILLAGTRDEEVGELGTALGTTDDELAAIIRS